MNPSENAEPIHGRMVLTQQVLDAIRQTIGTRPAECGGVLGADETGTITRYYFDETGTGTENSYEPDVDAINAVLVNDWLPGGIRMAGIVHSHANGNSIPSCGDIHYGMRILQALDGTERFFLPIVTNADGRMELNACVLEKDEDLGMVCRKLEWTITSMA